MPFLVTPVRVFLRKQAEASARRPSLEEVLLGGRFFTYAAYRLRGFFATRLVGGIAQVLEFTLLLSVFSQKRVLASLAIQQLTLLCQAFWWGCLEVMRQRLRADSTKTEMVQRINGWLAWALRVAIAAVLVPLGVSMAHCVWQGRTPGMLEAYVLACGLRIGLDVLTRTYYSGVYAVQRVYRPIVSVVLAEPVGIAAIVVVYPWLGGWAFAIGLVMTIGVSRGLAVHYTRRTYRLLRMPSPRLRLVAPRRPSVGTASVWLVAKAGLSNLSTRLGSIMVLAALTGPILAGIYASPVALAFQLAFTFLGAATFWTQVFYHDFRRLQDGAFGAMRRRLEKRLAPTALVVGGLLWAMSAAVLFWFVRSLAIVPFMLVLSPVYLAIAYVSILQLREFVRGGFSRLFAASVAVCLTVVVAAWYGQELSLPAWSVMVSGCIMMGAVVLAVSFRRPEPQVNGEHDNLQSWMRAASSVRGPISIGRVVMNAANATQCRMLGSRLAVMLADRGGLFVLGRYHRILWFERGRDPLAYPRVIVASAGMATALDTTRVCDGGAQALETAVSAGILRGQSEVDVAANMSGLVQAFRGRFGDRGLVADLTKGTVSPGVAKLPRPARRLLWADADRECHLGTTSGQHSGFEVTSFRPGGEMRALFAVPRSEPADARQAWRDRIAAANWDASTMPDPRALRANAVAIT
jgi:hypothetical protein